LIFEKLPGGKIPENVFRKEEHMPLIWLLVGILIGLLASRFIFISWIRSRRYEWYL